jgi:peptide/nickel transport system permease protein
MSYIRADSPDPKAQGADSVVPSFRAARTSFADGLDHHPAIAHASRAVLKFLLMVWIVATITFVSVRALPGSPVDAFVQTLVARGMTIEEARQRAELTLHADLDAPLAVQYLEYLANLARFDLGDSLIIARGHSVADVIWSRLPWTLFSVGLSLAISFWLGTRLGLFAAYRRKSRLDHLLTNGAAALDAIPAVVMAVLVVLFLGVVWQLVPITQMRGAYSPSVRPGLSVEFVLDALAHVAIPAFVYVLSSLGMWILTMRSNAIGVLGDDFVTMARARGLSESRIRGAYVGRNARLPLVTAFAIALGFTVGGSVLIEMVFVYPGVGYTLFQAIARRDYPVMEGVLLVTTICVLAAVTIADALYGWLDPRIRIPTEAR